MVIKTHTMVRPSLAMTFYVGNKASMTQHVIENFRGKIINLTVDMSDDLYTMTQTITFINESARTEWETDPMVIAHESARTTDHQIKGIVEHIVSIAQ
jgi:hypothetical protein